MRLNVVVFWLLLIAIVLSMYFIGFAFGLTLAVLLSGLVVLFDILFLRKERKAKGSKESTLVEYSRSFFPVLLIVWVIRSFIVQPYVVPTGSLEPTIRPGDFIAVNQFAYGLKFPVGNYKMISTGEPKRGDIVLFHNPANWRVIYIKRLIGEPGDHVVYKNKVLYVNGKKAPQKFIEHTFDYGDGPGQTVPVDKYEENLLGDYHNIYRRPGSTDGSFPMESNKLGDFSITVPKGHYWMMGDNRDNSGDSRYFGPVPERNIIGKAFGVWFSLDHVHRWSVAGLFSVPSIRWGRIGTSLLPHHKPLKEQKQDG